MTPFVGDVLPGTGGLTGVMLGEPDQAGAVPGGAASPVAGAAQLADPFGGRSSSRSISFASIPPICSFVTG